MTLYLDTSNLVKLYVDESDRAAIVGLVEVADVITTSVIAYAEARAAFARRRREHLITPAELKAAVRQLNAEWPRFASIDVDDEIAQRAGQLAEAHGLRGADALHLASFETVLARSEDAEVRFSCADDGLTRAAKSLK